jgi:squalene-hopene/tetraprenyl-beta-curcumene cyclase
MKTLPATFSGLLLLLGCSGIVIAVERRPITLDDVEKGLPEISPDEPIAQQFSAEKAAEYLDRSALNWQKTKNCATCHTNLFYMAARPALSTVLPDSGQIRSFYEDYPRTRWQKKKPAEGQGFWTIVVGTGLTFNDLQTTRKLSPAARESLDLMWTLQRKDGAWNWPDCNYAPMEIDDHYGATIAALTVGIAPDGYAQTPQAIAGLEKLRQYFKNNSTKSLHHRAMLAWCSIRVDGIATQTERGQALKELMALQRDDGGWSTAGLLSDWKGLRRKDGKQLDKPLDVGTSDGYGTGFVIVVARELGVPADDPRLTRGIEWILTHQRQSGKWFTRSPVVEARNLISNAGSAFDVLALQACGKLPGWPLGEAKPAKQ